MVIFFLFGQVIQIVRMAHFKLPSLKKIEVQIPYFFIQLKINSPLQLLNFKQIKPFLFFINLVMPFIRLKVVSLEEHLSRLCLPSVAHYLRIRNINIVENRRDELNSARKPPQILLNFLLTKVSELKHTLLTFFTCNVEVCVHNCFRFT